MNGATVSLVGRYSHDYYHSAYYHYAYASSSYHYCYYSCDLHYAAFMTMELLIIGEMIEFAPAELSEAAVVLDGIGDDDSVLVDFGFTFDFFGRRFQSVWIGSNGFLTFTQEHNSSRRPAYDFEHEEARRN